jgi:hypothetical protein
VIAVHWPTNQTPWASCTFKMSIKPITNHLSVRLPVFGAWCCLFGWLVGWLVAWLLGWLLGWLLAWLLGWLGCTFLAKDIHSEE